MFSHSLWESRIWVQPDWVLCSGSHRATVQVSASPQPHWRLGETLRLSSLGVPAELPSPQLRACAPGCWRLLGLTHRSSARGHPKHSHARPRQQGRLHGWGQKRRGPTGEHTGCLQKSRADPAGSRSCVLDVLPFLCAVCPGSCGDSESGGTEAPSSQGSPSSQSHRRLSTPWAAPGLAVFLQ